MLSQALTVALVLRVVDLRACAQQHARNVRVALLGRDVQRGAAVLPHEVNAGLGFDRGQAEGCAACFQLIGAVNRTSTNL